MAQVSLYMNDAVMDSLRIHSEKEGISISKYVGKIIKNFEHGQTDSWPTGYWEKVYGCLSDESAECMLSVLHPTTKADAALDPSLDDTALDPSLDDNAALDPSLDDACDWLAE